MPKASKLWEHFTRLTDEYGEIIGQAKCNSCSKVFKTTGTSSMWRHFKKFHNQEGGAARAPRPLPRFAPSGSGASKDREPAQGLEARRDLARMIALHGYDPSVVDDDYFKSFVRRINPGFEVPSRRDIEEMCGGGSFRGHHWTELYNEFYTGKVSLAVGQSKTIETGQVVYVTTHFIDHNWNLHREVDDVRMALPVGDHYHVPLRQAVPVVSLDNVVDDIVSSIQWAWWFDQKGLFMIAGETTGHINHLELKDRIQEERLVENSIYSATYMDHVLHSIARCLLPDSKFAENIFYDIEEVQYDLLFEQAEILTKLGLADDPWEYDERWYSCYCSLEIVHQNLSLDSDYEEYSEKLLRALWRVIYRAIKRVSDSSRPTSNLCLQELFNVREILKSQLSKAPPAGHPDNRGFGDKSVANVLREALETVDKAIQDSYLVWSVPLVLDPRYKLRHIQTIFQRTFGSDSAEYVVSEVRRKTKELYTSYIEHRDDFEDDDEDSDDSIEEMSIDSTKPLVQAWDEQCRLQDDSHAEAETELDHYLQDQLANQTEGFDVVDWWKVHGSVQYPTVARMARDALAMPTCSKLSSDQVAQVRSILRGYSKISMQELSRIPIQEVRNDIFNLARRDSLSRIRPASFAVDKAKTIKEEEEVEELSQGPAASQSQMEVSSSQVTYDSISSFHDKNIRIGTGHGKTTMGPPSRLQGNRNEWVLDTSAWSHHTFNLRLLRDLTMRNLEEVANTLPPEGDCLPVLGRGSVDTENFAVPDVSYIQGESRNVISVAQLARSHALLTVFEPTRCYVMDKMTKKIVGEGHLRDGTYVLDRLLISQLDGGGRNGSKDKEGKQGGSGGSGGGLFGCGSGDGGGGQGRGGQTGGKEGGDQAGGGADGGNGGGGGGGGGEKDKEKEGRDEKYKKDEEEEEEDDDEEMKEEKNEEEEKEKKGVEEEHQQLSRAPRGLVGPFQSVGTVPTGGVFVTPTQRNSDFIMDSGAGHHVTYFTLNQDFFRAYPEKLNIWPPTASIHGVDGVCLDVAGIGYLEGQHKDAIDYVLYVPRSVANLVSVRQLASDYSVRVLFDASMFSIERLANGEMVGSGVEKGNVYVLEHFRAGRLVQT